jgi:hypothetical protein
MHEHSRVSGPCYPLALGQLVWTRNIWVASAVVQQVSLLGVGFTGPTVDKPLSANEAQQIHSSKVRASWGLKVRVCHRCAGLSAWRLLSWAHSWAVVAPHLNNIAAESMTVFENRMLWRVFQLKGVEVTGGWGKLHNKELHNLYCSPNIIRQWSSQGGWDTQGMQHAWERSKHTNVW